MGGAIRIVGYAMEERRNGKGTRGEKLRKASCAARQSGSVLFRYNTLWIMGIFAALTARGCGDMWVGTSCDVSWRRTGGR